MLMQLLVSRAHFPLASRVLNSNHFTGKHQTHSFPNFDWKSDPSILQGSQTIASTFNAVNDRVDTSLENVPASLF